MIALVAILAALMGLTLGLLGGGGSVLAVPLLLYVVGLGAKEAIATSLLVVGATSLVCAGQHARAGNVKVRTALIFGAFAMIGAYLGGLAAQFFDGTTLLLLFAGMMVAAGIAMLRKRSNSSEEPTGEISFWKAGVEGLIVGAATGLVGAGGGFLVVPALVLFGGLDMRSAVGTSTLVIAMKSFAAFAGHASHVTIDWELAGMVTAFAVVGSIFGISLVKRIEPAKLRRGFGVFVLAMAALIVGQEAPASVWTALSTQWPIWVAGVALVITAVVLVRRRMTT